MKGDVVPVGVGKGKGAAKGAVDGRRDNRIPVGRQSVVDLLDPGGVQPDGRPDAGPGNRCQIGSRNNVPQSERDRSCLEDDGVGRAGLGPDVPRLPPEGGIQ